MDDGALAAGDYTAGFGSTKVTLNESYLNNLDAGEHTLKTTYDYGVEGGATEVSTNFKVTPTSITRATIAPISPMVHTGNALTPKPVLTLNGVTLREGVDYDLAYADNVNGGQATITITGKGNFVDSTQVKFTITDPSLVLTGMGHVQDKGDVEAKGDETGITIGSTGEGKRLEAYALSLPSQPPYEGSIEYTAHVQDIGWQKPVSDGNKAGTTGQAKRIEAVRIKLTGEISKHYDVWYRVHVENYGWLGWAKNDECAGTAGKGLRAEAIEIRVLPVGSAELTPTAGCYMSPIAYTVHVQDYGWIPTVGDGALGGTEGQAKRLEGIRINLVDKAYDGSVVYKTHVQDVGWESKNAKDGELSGTTGQGKRLEAVQIDLEGDMASKYDVWYRTHVENYGWLGWAKNGDSAGSEGKALRMEAVEIVLVADGAPAPGPTDNAFVS